MVGKPKAFFIQSCRGEAYQDTMVQPDNDEEEDDAEKFRVPTDGDIFIAYSTTEGKDDQFRIYIGYSVNLIYVFQQIHTITNPKLYPINTKKIQTKYQILV